MAQKGDQIYMKGRLVDYSVEGRGGERKSSTSRTDSGRGACEVVYLEDFRILRVGNAFWRGVYFFSKSLIALSIILWIYFNFIYTPPNLRR